jgi:hypothetical protein
MFGPCFDSAQHSVSLGLSGAETHLYLSGLLYRVNGYPAAKAKDYNLRVSSLQKTLRYSCLERLS